MNNALSHTLGRQKWIDVAKGIGLILVVIGHSNPPDWLKLIISSFHMPLFFFLSGYVYHERIYNNTHHYATRLKKDFVRLIIPYLITVLLIGFFLQIIQSQGKTGYYDSIADLCKSALFGSGSSFNDIKLIGEIWFLLAMFWARRIMDALFLCANKSYRLIMMFSIVGIGIALAANGAWVPMNIDIAFVAVCFLYTGWIIQRHSELIDNAPFLFLLVLLSITSLSTSRFGMSSRNYYNLWFISIPGAIALSILTSKASKLLCKFKGLCSFLAYTGKHSLLFFCIHSLDWRMPFSKPGQALVSKYHEYSWSWALSSIHRFFFDLLLTLIIWNGLTFLQRVISKIKDSKATR